MIKICRNDPHLGSSSKLTNHRSRLGFPTWVAKCGQKKAEMKIWVCLNNGIYLNLWEIIIGKPKNFQTKFILVAFNIIQLNWAAACHLLAPKTTAFQFFHSGLFHFNIISRNHAAPSRKDDICNEKGHRGVVLIRSGVHRFFKHPINLYSRFDLYCNYCHSIYVMTVAVAFDYISICIICPSHFHIFPPGKKRNQSYPLLTCSPMSPTQASIGHDLHLLHCSRQPRHVWPKALVLVGWAAVFRFSGCKWLANSVFGSPKNSEDLRKTPKVKKT